MVQELRTDDLVNEIAALEIGKEYTYVSGSNKLAIERILGSDGPIIFYRYNNKNEKIRGRITSQQLARFALVCSAKPNFPIHIDRVFSGGGNSRSALETLLAYTPHFFMCKPDRVDAYTGKVKRNLKHIMWCPDETHELGTLAPEKEFLGTITELDTSIDFGDIKNLSKNDEFETIAAKRVHVQMQIALIAIGHALNLKTWIARNDHSIVVGDNKIIELPGAIKSLDEAPVFFDPEIKDAASLIDCIWFTRNFREVPAIIEVEHSTGVTSGLTRMLKFRDTFRGISPIYTIVAPDELRAKVVNEISQDIFRPLKARFMSYTNVRELYGLIQRYKLVGLVDHKFVEAFMEEIIT